MERKTPNPVWFACMFLFFGSIGVARFSQNVRSVDAVGLFASGMACGAAVFGFIGALRARIKARS
jgi:hypothetical protein